MRTKNNKFSLIQSFIVLGIFVFVSAAAAQLPKPEKVTGDPTSPRVIDSLSSAKIGGDEIPPPKDLDQVNLSVPIMRLKTELDKLLKFTDLSDTQKQIEQDAAKVKAGKVKPLVSRVQNTAGAVETCISNAIGSVKDLTSIKVFDADIADKLYLGAILDGNDLLGGKLTPINIPANERAPMQLSLFNGGATSATILNPDHAAIENAVHKLFLDPLAPTGIAVTASVDYSMNQFQAALAMGFFANGMGVASASGLSTSFVSNTSTSLIQKVQTKTFHVQYKDQPQNPEDLFSPLLSQASVDLLLGSEPASSKQTSASPVYVSQIDYGGEALAQSTFDVSAVGSLMEFSALITTGIADGGMNLDASASNVNFKTSDVLSYTGFPVEMVNGAMNVLRPQNALELLRASKPTRFVVTPISDPAGSPATLPVGFTTYDLSKPDCTVAIPPAPKPKPNTSRVSLERIEIIYLYDHGTPDIEFALLEVTVTGQENGKPAGKAESLFKWEHKPGYHLGYVARKGDILLSNLGEKTIRFKPSVFRDDSSNRGLSFKVHIVESDGGAPQIPSYEEATFDYYLSEQISPGKPNLIGYDFPKTFAQDITMKGASGKPATMMLRIYYNIR
jgi:hypothetical protein